MLVDAIIATTGTAVLLPLTFGGLIATRGRRSEQLLVAPRGARFGDATALVRAAIDASNQASLETSVPAPSAPEAEAAKAVVRTPLVVVPDDRPFTRSDRRAA